MSKWLKRLRAAIGMGLTWAAAWFGLGLAIAIVNFAAGADAFGSGLAWLAYNSLLSAGTGFVGGVVFSGVLGIAGRHVRFDQMTLPRFSSWGALGGILVGAVQVAVFAAMGVVPNLSAVLFVGAQALVGASSAAGSLALARRAEDAELLEEGPDVADVGLTEAV